MIRNYINHVSYSGRVMNITFIIDTHIRPYIHRWESILFEIHMQHKTYLHTESKLKHSHTCLNCHNIFLMYSHILHFNIEWWPIIYFMGEILYLLTSWATFHDGVKFLFQHPIFIVNRYMDWTVFDVIPYKVPHTFLLSAIALYVISIQPYIYIYNEDWICAERTMTITFPSA